MGVTRGELHGAGPAHGKHSVRKRPLQLQLPVQTLSLSPWVYCPNAQVSTICFRSWHGSVRRQSVQGTSIFLTPVQQVVSASSVHARIKLNILSFYSALQLLQQIRPAVCLSVTRWHCDPRYDHEVFTAGQTHDSSFLVVNFSAQFQRKTGSGGAEWERDMKNRQFQPISRRISETVQDRTTVTTTD